MHNINHKGHKVDHKKHKDIFVNLCAFFLYELCGKKS